MIIFGRDTSIGEPRREQYTQTSTAALATVCVVPMLHFTKLLIQIVIATNDVDVEIYGSNDLSTLETLFAQTTIATGANDSFAVTDAWKYIYVKIVDTVAAAHGDATVTTVSKVM